MLTNESMMCVLEKLQHRDPATNRGRHWLAYGISLLSGLLLVTLMVAPALAEGDEEHPVNITAKLPYVDLHNQHSGKLRIDRNQDTENMVDFDFAYTSRKCPPFCVQPMVLSPGVETIGELEMIDYIKRMDAGDKSILVIDSRGTNWTSKWMIPGAISIPWTNLHYKHADRKALMEILEFQFDVAQEDDLLNFMNAKTLVLYCNGNWCGQSPTNIRSLLMLGYPAHKLKWYLGGMQGWQMLGFTTVTPP